MRALVNISLSARSSSLSPKPATAGTLSVPARALRTPCRSLWNASSVRCVSASTRSHAASARCDDRFFREASFQRTLGASQRALDVFHSPAGIISPARCQRSSACCRDFKRALPVSHRVLAAFRGQRFFTRTAVPTQQTSHRIQTRYA